MSSFGIRRYRKGPANLNLIPEYLEVDFVDRLNAYADFLVFRARFNAPIDKGDLRSSIYHTPIILTKRGWYFKLAASSNHASFMHEWVYKLGPKSAAQPPTEEGGVGRKYLARVAEYWLTKEKLQRELLSGIRSKLISDLGIR